MDRIKPVNGWQHFPELSQGHSSTLKFSWEQLLQEKTETLKHEVGDICHSTRGKMYSNIHNQSRRHIRALQNTEIYSVRAIVRTT
jgi:hypothetical protein